MFTTKLLSLTLSALLTIVGNGNISYLGDPGNWNGFIGSNAPSQVSAISVDYYETDSDNQTTANVLAHFRTTTLLGSYDSGSDESSYSGYLKYTFETQSTVSHISFDTLDNPDLYIQFGTNVGVQGGTFTFYVFFHGLKNIDFEVLANKRNLMCDITVDSGSIVTGTGGYSNLYDLIEAFKNQNHLDMQNIYDLNNKLRNYQIPIYSYQAYYSCLQQTNIFDFATDTSNFSAAYDKLGFISSYPVLKMKRGTGNQYFYFVANQNTDYYFLFMSPNNTVPFSFTAVSDGSTIPLTVRRIDAYPYMYTVKWNSSNKNAIRIVSNVETLMIPIFIGNSSSIPDDLAQLFEINKYENTTNSLDQTNDNLNSVAGEQETITSQFDTSFNNSINNIPTSSDLSGNSNFLNSANWVKTQFDNLTNNNAFGSVLQFSLIIGFSLALFARFF